MESSQIITVLIKIHFILYDYTKGVRKSFLMPVYDLSSCELLSWQVKMLGSHQKHVCCSKPFQRLNRSLSCSFCKVNPLISKLYLSRAVKEDRTCSLSDRTSRGECLFIFGNRLHIEKMALSVVD